MLAALKDMHAHVSSVVDARSDVDGMPGYHVYATRSVRAGQPVGRDDLTLSPPRPCRSALSRFETDAELSCWPEAQLKRLVLQAPRW
jgi:hypothetical protein